MSVLSGSAESLLNWVPFAVFLASLAGSIHCVGMCGGLVTAVAPTRFSLWMYQAGRLISYGGLGGLAGAVGERVFGSGGTPWSEAAAWVAALGISGALIFSGVRSWRGKAPHLPMPAFFRQLFGKIVSGKSSPPGAFATGLLSSLLPCGWLHSFVLSAAATRSAGAGALLLTAFWAGTLPAMVLAPALVRRLLTPLSIRLPRFSAVLLISAGLLSVGFKVVPLISNEVVETGATCHDHPSSGESN